MYAVDVTPGATVALITFGSFTNPGRTEPSYAFMNTVLRLKRKHGFVFDAYYFKARENDWYFSGTEGQSSLEDSIRIVREVRNRYDRVLFLGNSMGGYGALLFGLEVIATEILAFSPQTRFDGDFYNAIGERRWQNEFSGMRAIYDVSSMAIRSRWPVHCLSKVQAFAGGLNLQDMAYCLDLIGLRGFNFKQFEQSGHDLVHDLRATGQLEQIIVDAIIGLSHED